jgi:hypothetical protein
MSSTDPDIVLPDPRAIAGIRQTLDRRQTHANKAATNLAAWRAALDQVNALPVPTSISKTKPEVRVWNSERGPMSLWRYEGVEHLKHSPAVFVPNKATRGQILDATDELELKWRDAELQHRLRHNIHITYCRTQNTSLADAANETARAVTRTQAQLANLLSALPPD